MSKIEIALTDDWELRGNGLGDVASLQFRTAMRLMDLYERLGVRSTFNAEVMQQLAFEAHSNRFPEIAAQRDLWISAVRSMIERGFDVQLHLHPQWYAAEYDGRWWRLDPRWHIVDYPADQIEAMVQQGQDYLAKLTGRKIVSFRAGAW